ncbi:hypothetical protein COP1_024098 [Malus domestica]
MVTASQLQIVQSPITSLVSTVSASVHVKLDDSNYLNWQFQMQLLLDGHGIMGFVDGSTSCPARFVQRSGNSAVDRNNEPGLSTVENEDYIVWKMHDRALMQLITATLSPVAVSCAIGSVSSQDLWTRLKEQFSTVSRTSIFQMKSNLQTIKKGSDSVSQYLQKIKEARDYLSAAGVHFADEDIVILALNGLPPEYNTFRCVIRGRENVISLKEFRSQLLAEELIVETHVQGPLLSAMVADHSSATKRSPSQFHNNSGPSNFFSGGNRQFNHNKQKGRGKFNHGVKFHRQSYNVYPNSTSGVLGSSPNGYTGGSPSVICQLCNTYGHSASFCGSRSQSQQGCHICGKTNHSTWFCFYNDKGPNYIGDSQFHPSQVSMSTSQSPNLPHMHAMHTVVNHPSQCSSSQTSPPFWLADSGASNHMTADIQNLSLASPYPTTELVQTANGEGLTVSHIGSSVIKPSTYPIKLNSVLYVPKLTHNLLSVHKICLDNHCWLIFDASCFWIQDKATGRILHKGLCSNGLYPIPTLPQSRSSIHQTIACLGQLVKSSVWHNRFGHPSNITTSLMLKNANIPCDKDVVSTVCQSCLEGKFTRLPFSPRTHQSSIPFEIVHSDLWGHAPCSSIDGFKYYVTLIDECTRFCWIFPLINKSNFFTTFVRFCSFVHTQFSTTVKILQTDGGGEYVNHRLHSFLQHQGILHHKSCPYTPQQNGLAERKHRHVIETTITLLQHASLPSEFWSFGCQTAVYLINRMPTTILQNKSPFEALYGKLPIISHLKIFGCSCFPFLSPYNASKLQPKTIKCVFLGYASQYKGYICFDVSRHKYYISRHVVFNELEFPYKTLLSQKHQYSLPQSSSTLSHSSLIPTLDNILVSSSSHCPLSNHNHTVSATPESVPLASISPAGSQPQLPSQSITAGHNVSSLLPVDYVQSPVDSIGSTFSPEHLPVVLPIAPINLHPMQTRSKNGIVKRKAFLATLEDSSEVDLSVIEPTSYKNALKVPVWYKAMQEEIHALHSQGTWSLVSLPSQKNLVGCKWVFKLKRNADGSIGRHKARLVAKGFSQEPGLDFGETFSPVVKPTTVRLVLSLAAHFGWPLRQLDVKNAFLHGFLQEDVYMSQPPGFEDSSHPHLVCKLHKSLYGLKQAPRAWNERFTTFLPTIGFKTTYSDSSLFINTIGSAVVVLLLYVDDIIITGSSITVIQQVIRSLTSEFDLKDLGELHYFLGIQITRTYFGLFLSQSKYIQDLLQKTEMLEAKPCDTPCLPYNRLLKDDGLPYNNPTAYRSIVGALQYLTFTRPDISFSVHQVCQFMQNPMVSHFTAVKRILRYLKGTMQLGLTYSKSDLTIRAFSDADWAGDPNDRRSTTGLVVFLGSNPVSWSSKKQQTVSRSSTEAEYRAMSTTSAELDWILQVLAFLQVQISSPPVLFCDNLSAIALSFNPVQHQRSKHIEVDVHFVRERIAKKQLAVQFVSSREQFADIFTKGLSAPLFHTHCNNLMFGSSTHVIAGGC